MKVKPFCAGEDIEDFGKVYGDILEIEPTELYVKPLYDAKNSIYCYSICSNKNNSETILARYCDTNEISAIKCARNMIYILQLHKDDKKPFGMMNHYEILQWLKGTEKLLEAIKNYKE